MDPAEIALIEENPCWFEMKSGELDSARTRGSKHVRRKEGVQEIWQYALLRLL